MGMNGRGRQHVEAALAGILKAFETGKIEEAAAVSTIRRIEGKDVPSDSWSLPNRVLMFLHGTDDARGYRQWQAAGRQVRKGSRAMHILGPRMVKTKDKKSGEEATILAGFVAIPVFIIEDTDGDPVERPDYTPAEPPRLLDVAQAWGLDVNYAAVAGSVLGVYSPRHGEIRLATHDERVFWHELAHAAHDRVVGGLRGGQDPVQECAAELASAVLARMFGMKGESKAYNYIRAYSGKGRPHRVAVRVVGIVEKVLDLILTTAKAVGVEA